MSLRDQQVYQVFYQEVVINEPISLPCNWRTELKGGGGVMDGRFLLHSMGALGPADLGCNIYEKEVPPGLPPAP